MSAWHDREARNQALFREVNEKIQQLPEGLGTDEHDRLICECGNTDCMKPIELTRAEYERVRGYRSRFVVALNHQNPETESVVEQNERFAVIQTYAGPPHGSHAKLTPAHNQHVRPPQAEGGMRGESR